jgi:hypothetical protein
MITVSILGMDYYEAIAKTKLLHKKLVEAYGIEDDELEFFAPESFIIHDGFEQTSFRLNVQVEAPFDDADKEAQVKDILFDALKDTAVHIRVVFRYYEPEHEYLKIDDSYPKYMSESNTVKAEEHDHDHEEMDEQTEKETYDEPYMGDIMSEFDEYVKAHPNASTQEIYQALTGIREEVTEKHHMSKEEEDDLIDDFGNDQNE